VTIGRLEENCQGFVLDKHLQQVPPGMPGELWIGGAQVSRGYLDRPELTVDRFLPDPFSAGGRMYPTGELVSRRADGLTRHLGPAEDP
jgi:non-ribosomal peptide synthetase component F